MVFFCFTTKTKTCAIMEREARKVQEKQYARNSKEQVCLRNATEGINDRNNKGGMRNRMQSQQSPLQMDRLGTRYFAKRCCAILGVMTADEIRIMIHLRPTGVHLG